jgi:hypothetical protein
MAQESERDKTKKHIDFTVCNSAQDLKAIRRLTYKIFNIPAVVLLLLVSVSLAVLVTRQASLQGDYTPLQIFVWLIAVLSVVLTGYVVVNRPKILQASAERVGKQVKLSFRTKDIVISCDGDSVTLPYKAVRAQYWYDERYLVFIDWQQTMHELVCIPINEETFDDVYMVASALQNNIKRKLIRFKTKHTGTKTVKREL